MICDRIVVGITDRTLSERMQLDAELTLEKATTMTRQFFKEQAAALKGMQIESARIVLQLCLQESERRL
ncbi:hypothetical protein MTO96_021791 [Rhipicephalus appendiculatus]